ncbi:MAG: nucleotidyltransferase family protein [Tannerella sp.]|jgi:predicted nucleotidyltransferase|nr:nucleotidyltransferase family protein [Tannerella sp.]
MDKKFIEKLQEILPACLPKYPIEKAWLFGSYSRGEDTLKSDVDIMVRFDKNVTVTLFDYAEIKLRLEDLLHKNIDLVQEGCLYDFAKESAENDKILVYERNS